LPENAKEVLAVRENAAQKKGGYKVCEVNPAENRGERSGAGTHKNPADDQLPWEVAKLASTTML